MFEDLKRKYASNTNNNASKITTFEDLKKKYAGSTKIVGKQPTTTQTNSLGVPVTSSGDPSSDFQRFAVGVGVGGVTEVAKPVMVARENIKEDEIAREKALDEMGITNPIHRTALKMGDAIQEFGNDVGNTIWNAPTNVINWFLPEDKKLKTLTTDDRTTFINQDKYRTRTEQEVAEYVNQLQDKAIRMYGGVTKEGNTTKWAEVGKVYGNLLTLLTTNVGLKGVGANSTPALFGTHGAISGYANEGTTEGAITEGVKGAIMGKVFDNLSPVLNNVSNKVLGKYATNAGAQYGSGIVQGGIKFGAGNALGQFADIMKADPNGRYINQQELENMIKDGQIQNEEDLQREMMKQIAINRVIETGMSSLQGMLFNALFGVRTAKAKANMAGFKMEMSTQDAYKILGLDKNVTPEQIKSQYRKLAKQYHPDAHYGESAESIKQYEIKMKEITNAYDTLFKTFPAKNTTQASTQATQNNNNLMVLNPAENRLATNLGVATQRSGINTNLTMNNNQINKVNKSDIKPNIQDIQEIELDTQNFSRQVDEVIKGTFPNGDMLVVCKNTPKMLKDIGLTNLPITMTQKHLDTIMNETGKYKKANYHNLGIDIVKQLPEAISNPLDIVKSNTKDDSIILTTHLADKNNNTVIASIKLDGKGTVNDIRIDTNVMTSAYGKDNYETFMKKSIENDNILYDIDRGVIKKVTGERLQLPIRSNFSSVSNVPNTSINNSIQQNDTTVNSYSTQKTENNALGLENSSSFNLSNENTKERSWRDTALKNEMFTEEDLVKMEYVPLSNKSQIKKAEQRLQQLGYEKLLETFKSKLNTGEGLALKDIYNGQQLLVEAKARGDAKTVAELYMNIAFIGTELGQMTQALRVISQLSPVSQAKYIDNLVTNMNTKIANKYGTKYKKIELNDKLKQELENAQNQEQIDTIKEKIYDNIAEQMPVTIRDKIRSWRYLSMLCNAKTHLRNIIGNTANKGTIKIDDFWQRLLETAFSNKIQERTHTFEKIPNEIKEYSENYAKEIQEEIMGDNKYSAESNLEQRRRIYKKGVLEKLRKSNMDLLEKEDTLFSMPAFRQKFSEYLVSNGIKTVEQLNSREGMLEKATQYGIEQAEKATFRNANVFANFVNRVSKKGTGVGGAFAEVGTGAIMPFARTASNIAISSYRHSPVGLVGALSVGTSQVLQGKITATEYISRISQGLTGVGLVGLGAFLSSLGILQASDGDDKDDQFKNNLGEHKAFSLRLGDTSFDISWLAPFSIPIFMGAELNSIWSKKEVDVTLSDVLNVISKTLDPMTEMTFLSGVDDILTAYDADGAVGKLGGIVGNAFGNYVSQMLPTIISQFNSAIDNTVRTTKGDRTSFLGASRDSFIRKLAQKVPGLNYLLEPSLTNWGDEKSRVSPNIDNIATRVFNSFINPANATVSKATDMDKKLMELYNNTGNDEIFPKNVENKFTNNKNQYELNAKEYTQYKKTYGQYAKAEVYKILNTNLSDKGKIKLIKQAYEKAKQKAQKEYLQGKGIPFKF